MGTTVIEDKFCKTFLFNFRTGNDTCAGFISETSKSNLCGPCSIQQKSVQRRELDSIKKNTKTILKHKLVIKKNVYLRKKVSIRGFHKIGYRVKCNYVHKNTVTDVVCDVILPSVGKVRFELTNDYHIERMCEHWAKKIVSIGYE